MSTVYVAFPHVERLPRRAWREALARWLDGRTAHVGADLTPGLDAALALELRLRQPKVLPPRHA